MEEIIWPDRVKNEAALQRDKDSKDLYTAKSRKANLIGRVFRRNCHLKHGIVEGE